ncbi:MAG TPA: GspH/FimT family pseudopilin [Burkholderiales bacterium]|nr:GspH/FimT family pseudopilin [Burkholderiales bacterium]
MRRLQQGMTMIEMMVALVIAALILMLALPSFSIFLQNQQIRNGAESILDGLNFARTEAVRLNTPIRFQFVSDLTASCTLSASSMAWVISPADPTGICDQPVGVATPPTIPPIIRKRSASEGTGNVVVTSAGGATTAIFTGLGRLQTAGITQIDITNTSGACQYTGPSGTMRCLRILVSSGGQARLCDPQVATPVPPVIDPRAC